MENQLTYRKATIKDIADIVRLLIEDELGSQREQAGNEIDPLYIEAFKKIDSDPNQYLMVAEREGKIIGTCHLTIMSSMPFKGSTRMQIEAVRVAEQARGHEIIFVSIIQKLNLENIRIIADDIKVSVIPENITALNFGERLLTIILQGNIVKKLKK